MSWDVMLEVDDRIQLLGREETQQEAEQKILNYITNTERIRHRPDFRIWIEEDNY